MLGPLENLVNTQRTTFTLADTLLLRATTPNVLLAGFGRCLRKSVGGIGNVAEVPDDDYAKSFNVKDIDFFLSHSWHASWLNKYSTLLIYFNALPSIVVTSLVVGVTAGVLMSDSPFWLRKEPTCKCTWKFDGIYPCFEILGSITFIITMVSWHHILALLRRRPTLFLDKVCIHQTDAELKVRGIKSIGAVLANSKVLLVAWDESYFQRLWCTYEISAFSHASPQGKIKVLPVALGEFVMAYTIGVACADIALFISTHFAVGEKGEAIQDWMYFGLSALFHFPFYVVASRSLIRYMHSLGQLKTQMAEFSVLHAQCFCCTNNHRHPDTGQVLPCDRELVNASIEHWMGLDIFDHLVRGQFKYFVKCTLGGWAKIPYYFALVASIFPGLATLDVMYASRNKANITRILFVLEATFLRHPMIIGIGLAVVRRFASPVQLQFETLLARFCGCTARRKTLSKMGIDFSAGMVFTGVYFVLLITSTALAHYQEKDERFTIWLDLWRLFQALAVYYLYRSRRQQHDGPAPTVNGAARQAGGEVEMTSAPPSPSRPDSVVRRAITGPSPPPGWKRPLRMTAF
mmetsp:Transcript_35648/g.70503  ORF Transcript_35648/g.70503 Transcript_35648/m.70503 type:complete len:575 (+) Transcript_35648:75-1799(+)